MEAKKDNMPRIKELVSGRAVGVGLFVWGFFSSSSAQVIAKKFIWASDTGLALQTYMPVRDTA